MAASREIRVLIVEDHERVRAGIRAILEAGTDILVVGEAVDGAQGVQLATQERPDVILLDLELPILKGEAVLSQVLRTYPNMRVLILTADDDPEYARGMLEDGAAGYMLKEDAPGSLLSAVRSIHLDREKTWVSPELLKMSALSESFEQEFSSREMDILEQLLDGKAEGDIAAALDIPIEQVRNHLHLLMEKLGASSLDALQEIAQRIRLLRKSG